MNSIDHDQAFKFQEMMDYVESGAFESDLKRVKKNLEIKKMFDNSEKNLKISTLIGRNKFFEVLTDDNVIKNSDFLKSIYNKKEESEKEKVFFFDDFLCVKKESGIVLYKDE